MDFARQILKLVIVLNQALRGSRMCKFLECEFPIAPKRSEWASVSVIEFRKEFDIDQPRSLNTWFKYSQYYVKNMSNKKDQNSQDNNRDSMM